MGDGYSLVAVGSVMVRTSEEERKSCRKDVGEVPKV